MSLFKQLWLAILLLLSVVFAFSLAVSTLSARAYLEKQLSIKNSDNAAALALSLSQQGADDVLLELTLAAQFDTGYYQLIELTDPAGNSSIRREDTAAVSGAPQWFIRLFPIEAEPGVASLQAGWQQAGTLTLQSHSRYAYRELWRGSSRLAAVFLAGALIAGLISRAVVQRVLAPLNSVVEQSRALRERRFISIPEPATAEFKQLVSTMNNTSEHIQKVLSLGAQRLDRLQREAELDRVTGLRNRDPFLRVLDSMLQSDDVNATGALVLVRMTSLIELNETYGRKVIDSLLHDIGSALNLIVEEHSGWTACRLNGSDFALLAPREVDENALGMRVQHEIANVVDLHGFTEECALPGAALIYREGDRQSELLTRLDGALRTAHTEQGYTLSIAHPGNIPVTTAREEMQDWKRILRQAIDEERFYLEPFPVLDSDGELMHQEAFARLDWRDETMRAGRFLPWINRLQLSAELDRQLVQLALLTVETKARPVAVNLTVAAVVEDDFPDWLERQLMQHSEAAGRLWLEVPEAMAFRHFDNFRQLCLHCKRHGTRVGIEHVGHQLAQLGRLHDVGLDYMKVDAAFVRDIDKNPMNQTLLATLCTLGHSVGVKVIAEGVANAQETRALLRLGFDGVTGTGVTQGP